MTSTVPPFVRVATIAIVVFFANAALLVLQLVGGRLLAPLIGSSLATWTSVIGMFLAGISVGNWLGGRVADRSASSRTLRLLLWFGAATVLSALGLARWFVNSSTIQVLSLHPRIAVTTFLVCFPSACVLSMTTPVAIKLLLGDVRNTGRVVGIVYALGTLGSLIGNFVTGFVLMAVFGISAIVLGVAVGLVILGILIPPGLTAAESESDQSANRTIDTQELISLPTACSVVFIASFCSMALELIASRLLAPHVGVSIYTWTAVIGVVLAGVMLGNTLGGWVADRWPKRQTLGSSLFWCGLFTLVILVVYALGGQQMSNIDHWINRTFGTVEYSEDRQVIKDGGYILQAKILLCAAALFFLPMVAFGAISPQATRLAVRDWDHAGRVAGRVYAWSCAGAIAGTFATGWYLVGSFGSLQVIITIAALLIFVALPVGNLWRKPVELLGTAVALVAIGAVVWFGHDKYLVLRPDALYAKETNYYLVSVTRNDGTDTQRSFNLDHLIHSKVFGEWQNAGDAPVWQADVSQMGYGHEQVQAEFARAAADREANPKILVIGGGGYTLPRWVDKFLPQASMEVVEIDPGVTEAVYAALGMPRDTKIKSFNLDGRQFVQEIAKPGSYQLIIQDAVNDLSVPWHIMTKEYNDSVKKALTTDGVYLLTVIDAFDDGKLLPAAIRTMQESFPHVYLLGDGALWQNMKRAVFVIAGTNRPFDLDSFAAVLKRRGVEKVITTVLPAAELTEYLAKKKPPILTDDFAPVDNLIAETFRQRMAER